jgi:hypothetical protein
MKGWSLEINLIKMHIYLRDTASQDKSASYQNTILEKSLN